MLELGATGIEEDDDGDDQWREEILARSFGHFIAWANNQL
jgi:hypothetical protein